MVEDSDDKHVKQTNDFGVTRKEFLEIRDDQRKLNQIWQKITPLQTKLSSGIFDDQSLAQKVLGQTLDRQQLALYERSEIERRTFRYTANVEVATAMFD